MTGRRPPTGSRVPNTGSRTMAQGMGVLSSQLKVADRPVTQQGIRGIKTGSKGPNRQVQDRSYFMGLLRGKIQELGHEVSDMNKEVETYNQENATFLTIEKRAELLASQIKELQGEMADYNTLMDKLNTDTEIDVVLTDFELLTKKNDQEARGIDVIFAKKQEKEANLEDFRTELDSKKRLIEKMVDSMEHTVAEHYQELAIENSRVKKDLLEGQDTLDKLTVKVQQLKDEISQTPIKKEAFRLHQQLMETIAHLEEWKKTEGETAQQEQERLLHQVKSDNQEMGSIEKRIFELQDQLNVVQDQLNQVNSDMAHLHGERNDKYMELKKREESMKEFLDNFEESKSSEKDTIQNLESDVVVILEHISQNISQSEHMPSTDEYQNMQANLAFKKTEREKSEATTKTLDDENVKLQSDLRKVEDLEEKITAELSHLKAEIDTMEKEIVIFGDLERLHVSEDDKRQLLEEERKILLHRRSQSHKCTKDLSSEYEVSKSQFSDNDTYSQLNNLERKWQHHEQNNFIMKEFIATKQAEGNYLEVSRDVCRMIKDYNNLLCQSLSGVLTTN